MLSEAAVGADPGELAIVFGRLLHERGVETFLVRSSSGASRFSSATVPASGGRASVNSSVKDAVPLLSASIAVPIGSRSPDNSVTRRSIRSTTAVKLFPLLGQCAKKCAVRSLRAPI